MKTRCSDSQDPRDVPGWGRYANRDEYRNRIVTDLARFRAAYKETELLICADKAYEQKAVDAIKSLRVLLDGYIAHNPSFGKSFSPIDAGQSAPQVVKDMCASAKAADVGPMAAVAGAFAAHVGREMLKISPQVIVENGGDVFLKTAQISTIAIYAGKSPLSMKLGIDIDCRETPIAVCTSSGTVGHSKSFGKADAAVIVSCDACLADACATRLGNMINSEGDIQNALNTIYSIEGIIGAVAIHTDKCGAVGDIQLKSL